MADEQQPSEAAADHGKLLRRLINHRKRPVPTELPSSDMRLWVRLLADREVDDAQIDAFLYVTSVARQRQMNLLEYLHVNPDAYDRERIRQILVRAYVVMKSDDDPFPAPAFDLADIRALDPMVLARLIELYEAHQDRMTPSRPISEGLADQLAKAAEGSEDDFAIVVGELDARSLRRLLWIVARKVFVESRGA